MTVVGYVFLDEQDTEIPDEVSQQKVLNDYAGQLGLALDGFSVEVGVSKKRPFLDRVEGQRLFARLQRGDVILVSKAEWVLGSAREGLRFLTALAEQGIALYCGDLEENISLPAERKLVVSEGQAEFTKKLLNSLAAIESSRHGEAIKAAKRQMTREGKYIGGPVPFGWYVKDGFLARDKEQQKVIRQMRKWREDRWSYRDISLKLGDTYGIRLSHEGVRKVLLANDSPKSVDND